MEKRVLVVDDEKDIRDVLSRHFRLDGYEVSSASNGVEAMKALSKDVIRVVITDIRMPEMDGIDLLRNIRALHPMTRVIVITGHISLDNALACMRNHAESFIFKPLIDLTELDEAVVNAFECLAKWENKFLELQRMKSVETVA